MSFTANLYGHFADESKHDEALAIVRGAAAALDQLADRDAGDSFSGSFSGPTASASFPEPTPDTATVPDPDQTDAANGGDGTEASGS